jgi:prepilin-type N-terminal cleavage/methylation domain-containing protein
MPDDRRGFTLIELLIVAVVGAILLSATYGAMAFNQRATTVQSAQIRSQQIVRSGFEVIFAELREISSQGNDLLAIDADSIRFRSMRGFGIVCLVDQTVSPPEITVRRVGAQLEDGDSLFVFADGNTARASDDVWLMGVAGTVDTTVTCPGGQAAQRLDLPGMGLLMAADSVRLGAPVRSFEHFSYGLRRHGNEWYLARKVGAGAWVPLVGPVRAPSDDGLEFHFLDPNGVVTTDPSRVNQVEVVIRTRSSVRSDGGGNVGDSIATRIYMRN